MILKVKWGYILAQKLESDRSKSYIVPIPLQGKALGSSLQSPELENILQVPRNRDEVGQNNDSRKAVSATLSV